MRTEAALNKVNRTMFSGTKRRIGGSNQQQAIVRGERRSRLVDIQREKASVVLNRFTGSGCLQPLGEISLRKPRSFVEEIHKSVSSREGLTRISRQESSLHYELFRCTATAKKGEKESSRAGCSAQPPRLFDAVESTSLEGFDVLQTIDDAAPHLQIGRALAQPAPALQRARAQAPAAGEFNLVEVLDHHGASFLRVSIRPIPWGMAMSEG
jgi:hypothetical protein